MPTRMGGPALGAITAAAVAASSSGAVAAEAARALAEAAASAGFAGRWARSAKSAPARANPRMPARSGALRARAGCADVSPALMPAVVEPVRADIVEGRAPEADPREGLSAPGSEARRDCDPA